MKKRIAILTSLITLGFVFNASAVTTSPFTSAADLAATLLGSGVTVNSASYTGASAASGKFTDGAVIGIADGVLLTSGLVSNVGSVNTSDSITGSNGLGGDADLDALVGGSTLDATVLEMNLTITDPGATSLSFSYVFGSDEYNEFVNSQFNDTFGFFASVNGGTASNIALIPGTSTPVAINNVNNGLNSGFYNDNDPSNGTPTPFAFEYDGFTDVFLASVAVGFGDIVDLKLAIADRGDTILDSGVFLKGGSISTIPPTQPIPEPSTWALFGLGLGAIAVRHYRRKNS